ncbi:MAG: alpha/beta fold hydrolase [Candidatus Eremiobacteraeota bacterium]|nr:alpha/beta fold hydrolase [Candidatus Eremiobacteraeota bacterium]
MKNGASGSIPLEELGYGLEVAGIDPAALNDAVRAVVADAMMNPALMTTWLGGLAVAEQTIGLNTLRRMQGEQPESPVSVPHDDKRFNDPAWRSNPFLFGALEDYFVRSRAALDLVEASRLPEATRKKARFAIRLMLDAMAPSNVPWMNPAVVKEAMNSGGGSLMRGLQNFLDDVRNNGGQPRQVDTSGFSLGRNLAATPGRVIFRNALMELIAYEPQSAKVHEIPLLCSPPWINKYYIMDLAPGRSFVEWAIRHGHQTFMISYRNPDETMAAYTMDDYLREGLLTALDVVQETTNAKKVNLSGLCLGGTMVVIALAYLAAKGQAARVNSATVTNTLVDFSIPGDLGVFTDETTVTRLEERMRERGYLEADEMAGTFNSLRANDLIWSYVVNNWFMGKTPPAFDILAWNGDSTRMPAVMHSQYLRTCYLQNAIVRPNAFVIDGTPLDLGKIRTPLYVLGAESDHIALWHGSYATTQWVGGDAKYTLSNSGHVAGIVNPPENPKACYWTKPHVIKGESADAWRATAPRHEGSWWNDWAKWIEARAGAKKAPARLPEGDPAPGRYVRNEAAPPYRVNGRAHEGKRGRVGAKAGARNGARKRRGARS